MMMINLNEKISPEFDSTWGDLKRLAEQYARNAIEHNLPIDSNPYNDNSQPWHWFNAEYIRCTLLNGGQSLLPTSLAICPECGQQLYAECVEWDDKTGIPSKGGLQVSCIGFDHNHQGKQMDWQPIVDKVHNFVGAVDV